MTAQAFLWALAQAEETKEESIECYRSLSQLGSVLAQHKLAVLTGLSLEYFFLYSDSSSITYSFLFFLLGEGKSTLTVNPNYPKLIFDDMAPVFEKRLVQDLGYNCPWKMLDSINQLIQSSKVQ